MSAGGRIAGDVLVVVEGRGVTVSPGGACVIGRGGEADVDVRDPRVSRRHAVLHQVGDGWRITDLGSTNGLWHDGHQVQEVRVGPGPVTVRLGDRDGVAVVMTPQVPAPPPQPQPQPPEDPTVRAASPRPPARPGSPAPVAPTDVLPLPTASPPRPLASATVVPAGVPAAGGAAVRIGRGATNDLVLADLLVSRHHAELQAGPQGAVLVDLGSANGTFVNGHPIDRRVLAPGDRVTIGRHTLAFDGAQLAEVREPDGVEFAASHLCVRVDGDKQLLHDVSFSLGPRTLMAVVGPSGAGKSTMLNAVSGLRPPSEGRVLYAGRDLYAEYDELRQRIGFVPQADILHQVLTVRQALRYGARLRFPGDTTRAERNRRVQEVAAELSLTDQLGTRISQLSGGERKRASTAMELLTKPALLFLDEPTSGLDADLDRDVMHQLRLLADDGRTVVVITHNLANLAQCDVVMVLARGGHLAYLGVPDGVFPYFGVTSWADVFATLKMRPSAEWAERFRQWPAHDPRADAPDPDRVTASPPALVPLRSQSIAVQWLTLARRQLAVTAADRALLAILVLMPAVLALIARVIPGARGLSHVRGNSDAVQLLLVLVIGAALAGAAGAVRELVKERPLLLRERAVGLSLPAYLAAKVAVLAVIAVLQGVVLTELALAGRPPPGEGLVLGGGTAEVALVVAVLAAVSSMFGLVISALVRDENQAMPLLVLLTMAQLVLCGGLVPVSGRAGLDQLSWLLPSRWGFAGVSATVDVNLLRGGRDTDSLWDHTVATWWLDGGVLVALGAAAVIVTALLLRRRTADR